MDRKRIGTRASLIGVFVFLTLPCLTYLAFFVPKMQWLLAVDMALRAVPLYLAVVADSLFADGGELSPAFIPLWVALTGLLLWPLLVLGVRPALWRSRLWRWTIEGYAAIAVVGTVMAASWIFTHMGYFF